MLQIYAIPQMQYLKLTVTFQQYGALFHWDADVLSFLSATFPYRLTRPDCLATKISNHIYELNSLRTPKGAHAEVL